ncbi:MAG: hypothetical protein AB1403_22755 [Candidatus Riflebacteria bacterium]
MLRKLVVSIFIFSFIALSTLTAQDKVASASKQVDPVLMTNQLMLVFMERMKNRDYKEAREIANEMIFAHDKLADTDTVEHKSFHSAMEFELYKMRQIKNNESKEVKWVEQPVSDGFYLLAMLDFQEGNHDQALASLQKAINWNPVRSAFFAERGFMLLKNNKGSDYLMAQIAYKKALELADNGEDFAAALRGLAFIAVERGHLAEGLAFLIVSKQFDPTNLDAEEELVFIRRADPDLFGSMSLTNAKELMRKNGYQTTYSPEHIQVLMRLADNFSTKKAADKAVLFLKKAREMDPENAEIKQKLQSIEKSGNSGK